MAGPALQLALRLGGLVFEVVAGREGAVARARQDRDPELGIGLELVEDARQLVVRRPVERVHALGAVDRHDEEAPVALGLAELQGLLGRHGILSGALRRRAGLDTRLA